MLVLVSASWEKQSAYKHLTLSSAGCNSGNFNIAAMLGAYAQVY